MENKNMYIYDSPLGQILIIEDGVAITHLYFADGGSTQLNRTAGIGLRKNACNTNRAAGTTLHEAICGINRTAGTVPNEEVWDPNRSAAGLHETAGSTGKAAGIGSYGAVWRETALLKEAGRQLQEYFSGKRKHFSLPLAPAGTVFQHSVWNALKDIPYGETRSYGQIAGTLGNAKAGRAVGMANNKNPISIIIPCHRVIGVNGKLVGYGGGLDKKVYLLALEKENSVARE